MSCSFPNLLNQSIDTNFNLILVVPFKSEEEWKDVALAFTL